MWEILCRKTRSQLFLIELKRDLDNLLDDELQRTLDKKTIMWGILDKKNSQSIISDSIEMRP